jgi:hypothetical protein
VADPALFALPVPPPPDPNDYHPWGGQFSTFCEADTTTSPPYHALVAVVSDSAIRQPFVLGKHKHVLMRLATIRPHTQPSTGQCLYVALPGVSDADVQWGPKDVEDFWLATLSPDGKSVQDMQFLGDMVTEPSAPLDRN